MNTSYASNISPRDSYRQNYRKFCNFRTFFADKIIHFMICLIIIITFTLFTFALKIHIALIITVDILFLTITLACVSVEYFRRRNFYRTFLARLDQLDKAYLILETLESPNFYDGKIFYEALYDINKSMSEEVELYLEKSEAFREYIELWVHEAKTPLATLSLLTHNPVVAEQIARLDNYVDQVLYFSRAENAERDYHIKPTKLASVISEVANFNREILQAKHIDFSARNLDFEIETDAKWLKFIINQIITNSIKYRSSRIEVFAIPTADDLTLKILDNGIGIDPKDLPRVFEKSFTGENGHSHGRNSTEKSTGMGLYLAKTLCDKLGHKIRISSEKGRSTLVEITFEKHDYYNVTKK